MSNLNYVSVLEHGVNNSDHFPLICTFEGVIYDEHLKQKFDVKQELCIDWNVVNIEKYRHETVRKFGLTLLLLCVLGLLYPFLAYHTYFIIHVCQ